MTVKRKREICVQRGKRGPLNLQWMGSGATGARSPSRTRTRAGWGRNPESVAVVVVVAVVASSLRKALEGSDVGRKEREKHGLKIESKRGRERASWVHNADRLGQTQHCSFLVRDSSHCLSGLRSLSPGLVESP